MINDEQKNVILRRIAELPDRTTPEDYPDMLLVTGEELLIILNDELASPLAAERQAGFEEGKKAERERCAEICDYPSLGADSETAQEIKRRILSQQEGVSDDK